MLFPAPEVIKKVMLDKGYKVFEDPKGYDLNLFGIRTADMAANRFNDVVGVMYMADGQWNCFLFPATTDPGTYWRQNPMNVSGTAILKEGQYRGAYMVGKHHDYAALQQKGPLKVYRDANRNNSLELDESTVEEGIFSINIHHANAAAPSTQVDKWSAGCQVLQDPIQFDFLLSLAKKAAELHGNSFTYTLLNEKDFA